MFNQGVPGQITLTIEGAPIAVSPGTTVAVAMLLAGLVCRTSVGGEPRGPLCGMGIGFECRVVIDGKLHCRSCQILCEPGMEVSSEK
jgi:hypothetical protein